MRSKSNAMKYIQTVVMKEETLGTVSFSLPSVDKGEREIARVHKNTKNHIRHLSHHNGAGLDIRKFYIIL